MKFTPEQINFLDGVVKGYEANEADTSAIQLSEGQIKENQKMILSEKSSDRKESLMDFFKEIHAIRSGKGEEGKTHEVTPLNLSFSQAVKAYYGKSTTDFLKGLDIYQSDSLHQIGKKLGYGDIDASSVEQWVINYSKLGASDFMTSTEDVDPAYRFLIPELILQAIRVGYEGAARHNNWVASVQNISKRKITAPYILDGDNMPKRVKEGASIPLGTMRFGQKEVTVYKVGIGLQLTDELVQEVSFNMLSLFLAQVGVKMSIGADAEARTILINGDVLGGQESAPVVGVQTLANGITHYDIDNVMAQMEMLNMPVTRIVGSKLELIKDLNESKPERPRETVQQYAGVPRDMFILAPSQILFINTNNAIAKLQYKGLMVERRRNPQTQTEETFVSDHVGFMVVKRDARVILDSTVTFASNGFPAYMDIEAYINTPFE